MPPGFERANIRFFYLFKDNITGLFSAKQSGDIQMFFYSTKPLFFNRYTGLGSVPRNFL